MARDMSSITSLEGPSGRCPSTCSPMTLVSTTSEGFTRLSPGTFPPRLLDGLPLAPPAHEVHTMASIGDIIGYVCEASLSRACGAAAEKYRSPPSAVVVRSGLALTHRDDQQG